MAVRLCIPAVKVDIGVRLADPPERAAEPKIVPPSKKVTVPVWVTAGGDTVAFRVTGWPYVEGFGKLDRVVAVVIMFTTCVACPLLPKKSALPMKVAVRLCMPAARADVVILANPPVTTLLPRVLPLSVKVTDPEGQ